MSKSTNLRIRLARNHQGWVLLCDQRLRQVTAIAQQTHFCSELLGQRPYSELKGVRAKVVWLEGIVKYVEVAQGITLALDPREVTSTPLQKVSAGPCVLKRSSAFAGPARGESRANR